VRRSLRGLRSRRSADLTQPHHNLAAVIQLQHIPSIRHVQHHRMTPRELGTAVEHVIALVEHDSHRNLQKETPMDDERDPEADPTCEDCGGERTWCEGCAIWSRTCCVLFGTCLHQ
jgi:hypothetical protein